jgi:hypothetical protein
MHRAKTIKEIEDLSKEEVVEEEDLEEVEDL